MKLNHIYYYTLPECTKRLLNDQTLHTQVQLFLTAGFFENSVPLTGCMCAATTRIVLLLKIEISSFEYVQITILFLQKHIVVKNMPRTQKG